MRKPIIVGNWKMNLDRSSASELCAAVAAHSDTLQGKVTVGFAPPAIWLAEVAASAGSCSVYGQNVHDADSGAYTGELSAAMLAGVGATGVLVGHSERRALFGDTDAWIARKLQSARSGGLSVILCVGESLEERDAGTTLDVVLGQLRGALAGVESPGDLVVAYEPVWAIGTGRTATPGQAQEVHAAIRGWWSEHFDAAAAASLRIQYGGSVKPSNAAELLSMPDIDGALVGGASLDAQAFNAIIDAAAASSPV